MEPGRVADHDAVEVGDVAARFRTLSLFLAAGLADGVFVAAWAVVVRLADTYIDGLPLSEFDAGVLTVVKFAFAAATGAGVVVYTVSDALVVLIRAARRVKREMQ